METRRHPTQSTITLSSADIDEIAAEVVRRLDVKAIAAEVVRQLRAPHAALAYGEGGTKPDVPEDYTSITLPPTGYLRVSEILKLIPISKSVWWAGVKSGRFPKSIHLSARTTVWKVKDIRSLIEELERGP